MGNRWLFAAVGLLAMIAGAVLWVAHRSESHVAAPRLAPAALFATTLRDTGGKPQRLGQYAGKVLVLNFWATWCPPCRAEMPAFSRMQERWATRGVQFLGLTSDDPARVERFSRDLPVSYPLLLGGPEVDDLAMALGNRDRLLPFTVVVGGDGHVLTQNVGTYSEVDLASVLSRAVAQIRPN